MKQLYVTEFILMLDFDFFSPKYENGIRLCDHKGCTNHAEYKAPKSPNQLNEYYYFCLEHVREYNKQWDFYRDLDEDAIEKSRQDDVTWNRPSWPFSKNAKISEDDIRMAAWSYIVGQPMPERESPRQKKLPPEIRSVLKALEFEEIPNTIDAAKKQYRILARRWHPDHNHGDKMAENKLKQVNIAFSKLKKYMEDNV